MSNRKISELQRTLELNGSDIIPVVSTGENKKVLFGDFAEEVRDLNTPLTASSGLYNGNVTITGSLLITGSIENVEKIDFQTVHQTPANVEGRLTWNDTDGTLNLGMKGGAVTLQVGQEEFIRVVNKTGANLLEAEYKVVRVRLRSEGGAQGQRLAVVNAQAGTETNSATTLGIVTEDIPVNEEGFITTFGKVRNINTTGALQGETWEDGDTLYLSATTPGGLTKDKPISPDHLVIMGYVVYAHANNGIIFVKVDNGYEIDELHNVLINTGSLSNGQLLTWNSGSSVWTNTNNLSGSYQVTGSVSITRTLNLAPSNPLPSGTVGDLAVSGSSLYFYNGSWTLVV